MRRQITDWENIFANDTPDKELLSKIYKEHLKVNKKKRKNSIKKWAKYRNKHLIKEDTHEKMLHIICHQGNKNENNNKKQLHTY